MTRDADVLGPRDADVLIAGAGPRDADVLIVGAGPRDADVLIVGAGPAGVAAACALVDRGLRVTLAVRRSCRRGAETIGAAAAAALTALGCAPDRIGARACLAIGSAWGAAPVIRPAIMVAGGLGWHVDRAALDRALLEVARTRGVRLVGPAAQLVDGGAVIAGQLHRARAVLDARGPTRGDRATAVIALAGEVATDDRDDAMLRVEAIGDGWWYRVPHDRGATVALITDRAWVRTPRWRSRWRAALAATVLVGRGLDLRQPIAITGVAFAIGATAPDRDAHPIGAIARDAGAPPIGAAAWGFDPLCGDGVGLAIADAQRVAAAVAAQLGAPPPAGLDAWREVEARRRAAGHAHLVERAAWYEAAAAAIGGPIWERWRVAAAVG